MAEALKITHVILELKTGGAEKSLLRLTRETSDTLHHRVICMAGRTPIGDEIEASGTEICWFDYRRRGPLALWDAWRDVAGHPPDVLQGWMYFGNILASLIGLLSRLTLAPRYKLAWNIRQAPDVKAERRRTRWAMHLGRLPFLKPDHVIYNSWAGVTAHASLGYDKQPHTVILNGIDTSVYTPDERQRACVRAEHDVGDQVWISMVCRLHPLKGVDCYLSAIASLKDNPRYRFSLAGPGMDRDNEDLMTLIDQAGLERDDVDCFGTVDVAKFLPGLDVLVLASRREGTPNILLEAMACEVGVVATNVGDVERILDDPSRVVVQENELPEKIRAIAESPQANAERDRQRILDYYTIDRCMAEYAGAYAEMVDT